MNIIEKIFIFLILLIPNRLFSQEDFKVSDPIIKSPQVHLLKQFVDYPVDLSRGLVDISVPIYDINFSGIEIPIKLMFHPSGLKANVSENGELGLKWALNINSFICREVRGYPDELKTHKQGISSTGYTPDWKTLYGTTYQKGYDNNNPDFSRVYEYEDTEYDIFSYSLPTGQSGKFILKDEEGKKKAVFMPYKPYKVHSLTVEPINYLERSYTKMEIIDDKGYTYRFGKNDAGKSYYENSPNYENLNCWLLNSIVSPNKLDTIKFDYISRTVYTNNPTTPVIINDNLEDFNNYYSQESCQGLGDDSDLFKALESILYESSGYLEKNYNQDPIFDDDVHYLSKIQFKNGYVNFTYSEDNDDCNDILLNEINIKNNQNNLIKKVVFDIVSPGGATIYSYEKPSYLRSLSITDSSGSENETYEFDYYHLDKLPAIDKLANCADYWGYYQSNVSNVILKDTVRIQYMLPTYPYNTEKLLIKTIGEGNNRYSNEEDMKIGMLKSITYPTGGVTTFDYEGNYYKDDDAIKPCGGLKIKSIVTDSRDGKLQKRLFTYGTNEDGAGIIPIYLKPLLNIQGRKNWFEEIETTYCIEDNDGLDHHPNDGEHDYTENGTDIGTYTTRYITGQFPGSYYTFLYNLVYYDKVTEYHGDKQNNIGKTEYYYSNKTPSRSWYDFDDRNFTYKNSKAIINSENFWYGNHLQTRIDFDRESDSYSKVKHTNYYYGGKILDKFYDLSVFRFRYFVGYQTAGGRSEKADIEELEEVESDPSDFFGYKVQTYTSGVEKLSKIIEETFLDNGSYVQTTINNYDTDKPTYLSKSITIDSKGDSIIKTLKYPFNIDLNVYSQMSDSNITAPVIEKTIIKNNKLTNSILTTYKKTQNNFLPDKVYTLGITEPISSSDFTEFDGTTKDSHYGSTIEASYDYYDSYGNPTQITTKDGLTISYLWDSTGSYPMAKVEGATYSQISSQNNKSPDYSSITLYNKLKSIVSSTTVINTYSYKPLVGMISQTDPNGRTTYYKYDNFGRLEEVKDSDGNVLKSYDYNYSEE